MRWRMFATVALVALGALAGCAHSQSPVLYPNAKLQQVGKAQADRDIAACRQLAGEYVSNPMAKDTARGGAVGGVGGAAVGAVAGAVTGHGAGRGAMVGAATGATAGAVHGAAKDVGPTPVYKGFVNRVGDLAERQQHHPDIAIHYSEVTLSLWSHDAGGVTARDVKLAEAIDAYCQPTTS